METTGKITRNAWAYFTINMKKIRVCCSRSCAAFGAKRIMQSISEKTGLEPGQKNENFDLDYCGCLGWCSNSLNVEIDDHKIIFDSNPQTIFDDIQKGKGKDMTGEIREILDVDNFLGDL